MNLYNDLKWQNGVAVKNHLFKMKKSIGAAIRTRRESRNIPQAALGDRGTISNIEGGKRFPNPETLLKICIALECEPSDIYKEAGY